MKQRVGILFFKNSMLYYFSVLVCIGQNEENLSLEEIMIFFSGAEAVPPLGFSRKARLYYSEHIIYPESSTCGLTLTLPTRHADYSSFKSAMIFGMRYEDGSFTSV